MMILYLIVPCFNEEEGIEASAFKLRDYLESIREKHQLDRLSRIVFVNDGSSDRTLDILNSLHRDNSVFSVISFSRNYGHQYAVMAGYEFAAGKCDACISIDADLQQDINAIDSFLDSYEAGNDVVYGVRNSRDTDSAFKAFTSQAFYGLMTAFGCEIIPNHADYRLLSSKVLDALLGFKESSLFLRGMLPSMGYKSDIVYFDVFDRTAGSSKYTLKKMLRLAIDGITSYSEVPVHMIVGFGAFLVGAALLGLLIGLIVFIGGVSPVPWVYILLVALLFGINLLAVGVVGEYAAKAYFESKRRPRYLIDSISHE